MWVKPFFKSSTPLSMNGIGLLYIGVDTGQTKMTGCYQAQTVSNRQLSLLCLKTSLPQNERSLILYCISFSEEYLINWQLSVGVHVQ